jgi:hypothetical protein
VEGGLEDRVVAQQGVAEDIMHADERSAGGRGVGPRHDLQTAVAVEVAGRHPDAAVEADIDGLKLAELHAVGGAEDAHQGELARSGRGDDDVLTLEASHGRADSSVEALEGIDLAQEGSGLGVVDVDQGQTPDRLPPRTLPAAPPESASAWASAWGR